MKDKNTDDRLASPLARIRSLVEELIEDGFDASDLSFLLTASGLELGILTASSVEQAFGVVTLALTQVSSAYAQVEVDANPHEEESCLSPCNEDQLGGQAASSNLTVH